MKNLMLSVALICLSSIAKAEPYFNYYGKGNVWSNPKVSVGSCVDPVNVGNSQQCTMLAAIYHPHENGYLLFPGEDWTLLGIGYGAAGGGADLLIGPSWNILPIFGELATAIEPGNSLTPILSSQSKINGTFGPVWEYSPTQNKGFFRLFAGASWSF